MPAAGVYRFGPFELRPDARTLLRDGEPLAVTPVQVAILSLLVSRAGAIVSKADVVAAGWKDPIVEEAAVDKAISRLRQLLGDSPTGAPYLETLRRRGYRIDAPVSSDDAAGREARLKPHLRWVEGRAALQTLHVDEVTRAREALLEAVSLAPLDVAAHVALANACAMLFEATRADAEPDQDALRLALKHAQIACQLAPDYAEAWATLGFVLARTGAHAEALAAARRATTLAPGSWRHLVRLAFIAWGEDALTAARGALTSMPGLPMAHLLAARVLIARGTLEQAEREVRAGIAAHDAHRGSPTPFHGFALHWLCGLLRRAAGDAAAADAPLARELSLERDGHIYGRECAAHAWHAIGAMRLHAGDPGAAADAFAQALARVAPHPFAHAGLLIAKQRLAGGPAARELPAAARGSSVDMALARAALLVESADVTAAVALVTNAIEGSGAGSAGWLLPIEPLLNVTRAPAPWTPVLSLLRSRAC